jgi:hypothetical protein
MKSVKHEVYDLIVMQAWKETLDHPQFHIISGKLYMTETHIILNRIFSQLVEDSQQ